MSMQKYPSNPIEKRKQEVRKNSRNAAVSVIGGVGGGAVLALLTQSWNVLILGLVIAVVGGVYFYNKVKKTVEHQDTY